LLHQLRDDYPQEAWPRCAGRLEIAVQWMEAAVSTIHGWCQRMLREHAFDSGSLFTQTLETDHSEPLGQVMRDYWRRFCYRHARRCAGLGPQQLGSPDALLPRIRPLFGRIHAQHDGPEPAALIQASLAATWPAAGPAEGAMGAVGRRAAPNLPRSLAAKQVDGRKMQARYFEPWFDKLKAWAADEQGGARPGHRLHPPDPGGMAEAWKGRTAGAPGPDAMQTLQQQLQALEPRCTLA
jgi:exodeoxyribonuclease V beta subunit